MNWQHLQAFLWLRWRLAANQWRRGGVINAVLMTIITFGVVALAVPLFVASLVLAIYAFREAAPVHLLYAWDGIVVAFVFLWSIGVLTELQRTETLSLSKFLHLPVSIHGAFLINYLSSLVRLSLIIFVPVMTGFGLGLVFAKGASLLPVLPLAAAFLLMISAVTYQFQGWLASLMSNPRRRRTVVVATTAVFVLACQLPNLLNVYRPWGGQRRTEQSAKLLQELAGLEKAFQAQEFDAEEHLRRQQEIMQKVQLAREQAYRENAARWQEVAQLTNLILPIGWLPLGVMGAAEGRFLPATLAFLGMTLIGTASLWRAYRTTIRLYQGQFTAGKGRPAPAVAATASPRTQRGNLLEARLPGLSEPVAAVALGGLRSLVRSPEAKMMLLTPLLMGGIFGAMLLRRPDAVSGAIRPLIAIAAMGLVLFGLLQLMSNQFGFDRDGFRVFVLCAASRRDILLGKNLAFAPLAAGMGVILLTFVQVVCRLRWDHFLAMPLLFTSMFLMFCLLANLLSIYAPVHLAAGSLKHASPKLVPMMLQMAMFTCLFPLTQAPIFLPLGVEAALVQLGWIDRAPVCLLLSLAECAAVIAIYYFCVNWQGSLFQAREQKILEAVTNRA